MSMAVRDVVEPEELSGWDVLGSGMLLAVLSVYWTLAWLASGISPLSFLALWRRERLGGTAR